MISYGLFAMRCDVMMIVQCSLSVCVYTILLLVLFLYLDEHTRTQYTYVCVVCVFVFYVHGFNHLPNYPTIIIIFSIENMNLIFHTKYYQKCRQHLSWLKFCIPAMAATHTK